ncbi:MAG: glycosyltransferase family 4 protein [Chloroflexi bacterium]|nr:glycosyltransferase family 4 protein [Chloroflexota bacterium]
MHIVQVAATFSPYVGGATNQIRALSRCWTDAGHRVTLVVPKEHPRLNWMRLPGDGHAEDGEYQVRRVPLLYVGAKGVWVFSALTFYRILRHLFATDRPDVCFVHYLPWHSLGWAALAATRPLSIPLVLRVHDIYRPVGRKDLFFELLNNRLLLRLADRLHVPNASSKNYIARRYGVPCERLLITPNGLDLDRYRPLGQALTQADHPPTLCYVGALNPHRGLSAIVATYAKVREQLPDCRLLVIGDGHGKAELLADARRLGVSGGVEVTGALSVPEMVTRLREGHLGMGTFDTGSNYAEFQMLTKVLDYAAMGIPWVSWTTRGVEDLCADLGSGITTPADIGATAQAIVSLLGDQELRRSLAQRGVERAECYDWRRQATEILGDLKVVSSNSHGMARGTLR